MFRNTNAKKKKAVAIRRQSGALEETKKDFLARNKPDGENDDDEEEEQGPNLLFLLEKQRQMRSSKRKQKEYKKKGAEERTTVTAVGTASSKTSRKRQRIGYGGGTVPAAVHNNDEEEEEEEADDGDSAQNLYDAEVLAQLKAEQAEWNAQIKRKTQQQQIEEGVSKQDEEKIAGINRTAASAMKAKNHPTMNQDTTTTTSSAVEPEESFIPLNSSGPRGIDVYQNSILAGDEALEVGEGGLGTGLGDKLPTMVKRGFEALSPLGAMGTDTADDDAHETDLWQDQIAQRAGIGKPSHKPMSIPPPANQSSRMGQSTKKASLRPTNALSIAELRQQFVNAQQSLLSQIETVETAYQRRQVDMNHIKKEELQLHSESVESCGRALDFYQGWRAEAVPHVAALRDFSSKLEHLQHAMVQCIAQSTSLVHGRYQAHTDDALATLHESGRLERFLGRQPDPNVLTAASTAENEQPALQVDEFGRHVPSQYALQREKRMQQRDRIQREKLERHQQHPGIKPMLVDQEELQWILDSEIESLCKQASGLKEALRFALDQVKEDYRSLSNLTKLFSEWYQYDRQEYIDCYAGLSLADLVGVLIRLETCAFWLEADDKKTGLEFVSVIQNAVSMGILDGDAVVRLGEKSILPLLSEILRENAYNGTSSNQTMALVELCSHFNALWRTSAVTKNDAWNTAVGRPLVAYFERTLEEISLPVLKPGIGDGEPSTSERDAMICMEEQILLVERLIRNIVAWKDVLEPGLFNRELGGSTLGFLSNTFLAFLSSLGVPTGASELSVRAKATFVTVWKLLRTTTEWLKQPQFLIQATTLEAAAEVYQSR